jgi:hypothetical protein
MNTQVLVACFLAVLRQWYNDFPVESLVTTGSAHRRTLRPRSCPVDSVKTALLSALDTVLAEAGMGTHRGAVLSDLRDFLLEGKSRTKAQDRLSNRRGRGWRRSRCAIRPRLMAATVKYRAFELLRRRPDLP